MVELALKAVLRAHGVDPPRLHDVSDVLIAERNRLPAAVTSEMDTLVRNLAVTQARPRAGVLRGRGPHPLGLLLEGRRDEGARRRTGDGEDRPPARVGPARLGTADYPRPLARKIGLHSGAPESTGRRKDLRSGGGALFLIDIIASKARLASAPPAASASARPASAPHRGCRPAGANRVSPVTLECLVAGTPGAPARGQGVERSASRGGEGMAPPQARKAREVAVGGDEFAPVLEGESRDARLCGSVPLSPWAPRPAPVPTATRALPAASRYVARG